MAVKCQKENVMDDLVKLMYWVAKRKVRAVCRESGVPEEVLDLDEAIQEAVVRSVVRIHARQEQPTKEVVCQCTAFAAWDAVLKTASTTGNPSSASARRDDVTRRLRRAFLPFDRVPLDRIPDKEVPYEPQDWEVVEEVRKNIPEHLRATAILVTRGTQQQAADELGVTDRTIRNHLTAIRDFLNATD